MNTLHLIPVSQAELCHLWKMLIPFKSFEPMYLQYNPLQSITTIDKARAWYQHELEDRPYELHPEWRQYIPLKVIIPPVSYS